MAGGEEVINREDAVEVMRNRANQCRSAARAYDASMYHGEAMLQRARADAYDAAALMLQEMGCVACDHEQATGEAAPEGTHDCDPLVQQAYHR